jgi:AraC-like DNA-binding protein
MKDNWRLSSKSGSFESASQNNRFHPVLLFRGVKKNDTALPSADFKEYISTYKQLHIGKKFEYKTPVIFPIGCSIICFECNSDSQNAYYFGPYTCMKKLEFLKSDHKYFDIFLTPGQHYSLIQIDAKIFTNQYVPLKDLIPHAFNRLSEEINSASSFGERINVWEKFLEKQKIKTDLIPKSVSGLVNNIINSRNIPTNKEIANYTGFSDRQVRRLFLRYVGVSPNMFARIIRYQRALAGMNTDSFKNLAEIAYENGYCDQSHLNHDFMKFYGSPPSSYLTEFSEIQ